jgi:uncharacterized membrane protein YkvA (DUF1232 family)
VAVRSRRMLFMSFISAVRSANRPGAPGLLERFASVPRMLRATMSGEYKGLGFGRLALMATAVVYLLSPIDLLPEIILPIIGLADDAVVLTWIAAALVVETESFLDWERARAWAARGGAGGYAAQSQPGYDRYDRYDRHAAGNQTWAPDHAGSHTVPGQLADGRGAPRGHTRR